MTDDLHVPSHIEMTIRIADQKTKTATAWTVREQELSKQIDEHQTATKAEKERIEAELQQAVAAARRRLDDLDEAGRKLKAEHAEAGRCRQHHSDEALDAQQTVADWATRHGIRPDEIPQPDGTGPLPVVPTPRSERAPDVRYQENGLPMVWSALDPPGGWVCGVFETAGGPGIDMPDGTRICGAPVESEPCTQHSRPTPPPETSQPLPVIDDPDGLLAIGKQMADPGTTRTDLPGGEPPTPGGFQGDPDA